MKVFVSCNETENREVESKLKFMIESL